MFVTLPGKSTGNGIVFDRQGFMYVADYAVHNVLKIDMKTKEITVFAHEPKMNQPNDLAMAPDRDAVRQRSQLGQGHRVRVWAHRPRPAKRPWLPRKWARPTASTSARTARPCTSTRVSSCGVWAFAIQPDGSLADKRLLKKFDDFGFDGMRCDANGNLYITAATARVPVVVRCRRRARSCCEFGVLGKQPSNLCFGGSDGCTLYITEVEHQRLVCRCVRGRAGVGVEAVAEVAYVRAPSVSAGSRTPRLRLGLGYTRPSSLALAPPGVHFIESPLTFTAG